MLIKSIEHQQCTCDKRQVLTLTVTIHLDEIKLLKPVTCCYQLPNHSACVSTSHYRISETDDKLNATLVLLNYFM